MKENTIKYITPNEIGALKTRAESLGLPSPTGANLNLLGQALIESRSPRLDPLQKLFKQVKDTRKRQAIWRSQEKQEFVNTFNNSEKLNTYNVSKIYTSLKERKAIYGGKVFNFATPQNPTDSIPQIKLPENLPNIIWKMAEYTDKPFPPGLPMARIDAIRQSDNTIKIIEINPCWVDNIGALQAFYETYKTPISEKPVDILVKQIILRRPKNRNIALLYCSQAAGCAVQEIYSLADYLESTGQFNKINVSRMDQNFDLSSYATIYINGSFSMNEPYSNGEIVEKEIIKLQSEQKTLLVPTQFKAFDSKESLIGMSQTAPNLFLKTTKNRQEIEGQAIAKPYLSESLKGIVMLDKKQNINTSEEYIYQPIITYSPEIPLICVDSQNKTISKPEKLYEKINIWVIGNKIAGAMATYNTTPMINDAGYNLPISWQEI
jgi:hypothetical protein